MNLYVGFYVWAGMLYLLVPNLEWTPNRFGDPQIRNFDKSLPKPVRGSVQANIEYLYIRSYGQTASVTSNLWVYSRT